MAFSKAHKFEDAIYHFSLMCRALSHPARVMILKRLIALHGDRAKASELTTGLPITQQALSQHFRILREMSIVSCQEEYPNVYYTLNNEMFNTFVGIFSLVTQADAKYDESYKQEITPLGRRRTAGTTPV
jgi:DNA-binding transcriptional ArsR family regulator